MPKIFIFISSARPGFMLASAISEDGHYLAGHICANDQFVLHDMGITSTWKHDAYLAHYPNGFELELVPTESIETHLGLQKAFALNALLHQEQEAEPDERLNVNVTIKVEEE